MFQDPWTLVLLTPGLLFGFTIHEFSHAYAAYRLGDDTAARQGRLTLNPLMHLDLMGTILFLIAGFGWARPVPINPANFRDPKKGDLIATAAGPASNLVGALVLALLLKAALAFSTAGSMGTTFAEVLHYAVYVNLLLCFFNLIPIFPLDGARIVRAILPLNQAYQFSRLEPIGPLLLMGLIIAGPRIGFDIFGLLVGAPIRFFMAILS